jgi:hypothetical protein
MNPDYVRRDEFNTALQAILAEMRAIRLSIAGLDSKLDQKLNQIEQQQTDMFTYLKDFRQAVEAGQRDTNLQMAEGHAKLQEQINDIKRKDTDS